MPIDRPSGGHDDTDSSPRASEQPVETGTADRSHLKPVYGSNLENLSVDDLRSADHDLPDASEVADQPRESVANDDPPAKRPWPDIDSSSDEDLVAFLGLDRTDRAPQGRRGGQPDAADHADPGAEPDVEPESQLDRGPDSPGASAGSPESRPRLSEAEARERFDPERFERMLADRPGELAEAERTKTWGMLYDEAGNQLWEEPQCSRDGGPAEQVGWKGLRLPRAEMAAQWHLEAQTAAQMRLEGIEQATLYIDRPVCPYDRTDEPEDRRRWWATCHYLLEDMLPPHATLVVNGPDDFCKVYVGKPEEMQ